MNYKEAISFLFSSLPMYQRVGQVAYKSNLNNTLALDEYFDHPHWDFRSIHVAGTNGKGSVAHMLSAVLQTAGYKVGLYTSPHLKDFRERIRVNGEMIPEERVSGFVDDHREIIDKIQPSFFEMTVAMAFDHFRNEKVDIAVVEVGMGGRLDSTNIISPILSVITNIGMDHSQFLGDTLYQIAGEKAGIIKPGIPLVVGQKQDEVSMVFTRRVKELNGNLYFADQEFNVEYSLGSATNRQIMQVYREGEPLYNSLEIDLMGLYQQKNIPAVLKVLDLLGKNEITVTEQHLRKGLSNVVALTGLRGRWEILSQNPLVISDTAHNPEGMKEVIRQIKQMPWKNLHIVLGMVDDKDPEKLLEQLPREAMYYFIQSSIPRAMDREKLAREAIKYGLYGQVCTSPERGLKIARSKAEKEDLIFVGGSTFVVAEIL
ncbi:bifunctional folylpolyglutamate synthase/dihydrofolate synthase [Bacteroidota bacterium]